MTTWSAEDCAKKITQQSMKCWSHIKSYSASILKSKYELSDGKKEFKWDWNSDEENRPVSASIQGFCKQVEFYDEDGSGANYEDNHIWVKEKKTECVNLPSDLKQDLGGIQIVMDKEVFTDLGKGQCRTLNGNDPKFKYLAVGSQINCRQECALDANCHGYSLSGWGNCLLWMQKGLKGGGAQWAGASCYVKGR